MRCRNSLFTLGTIASIALFMTACSDSDAEYPSQSIDYIVPYDPGGGADPAGRQFSTMIADELEGAVDVINVPGGEESIGITQLATSDPDGHTLVLGTSGGFIVQPMLTSDA